MEVFCKCDVRPLIADAQKARRALEKTFRELEDLAHWAFEQLIDLTPQSGRSKEKSVAGSWELKFHKHVLYRELAWSVLNDNPVIQYLEYGTNDHWVYPKSPGGTLHWIDPKTGEDAFSKGHIVEGIKPGLGMVRITAAKLERKLRDLKVKNAVKISN